ncbi:hypothetical protein [Microbacterium capsulatum]|uniref:Uncharacterized protein n=1 Tax=Microbacterium capsulatum TaxID=3041921 RepID=A0ABU0XG03_9MICO|nr:hypothetical protein [Microbacterium sp. ASV81]MDQ4214051.1 hypothetical protein [Microbacterium sp. ASV81]
MTDARSMAGPVYTFAAIDPSMPGTFLVHTITGTMHIVVNDSAGESAVRRVRPQANSEFVGDCDWLPIEYNEIRVGEEASFLFTRSGVHDWDPAYLGRRRRTPRVIQITLYDGRPALPDPGSFGRPRGLPISTRVEAL